MNKVEYILLTSLEADVLAQKVTEHLNADWTLYGNPICTSGEDYDLFAQAMFRNTKTSV